MLNSQQNIMPYGYDMVNDLPGPSGINNASIPSLAPNMLTPMNNTQSFMPTQRNMQGTYADGGLVAHYARGGVSKRLMNKYLRRAQGGLIENIPGKVDDAMQFSAEYFNNYVKDLLAKVDKYAVKPGEAIGYAEGGFIEKIPGQVDDAIGMGANYFNDYVQDLLSKANKYGAKPIHDLTFAEGGAVGIEALLQQMSPADIQELIGQNQQGAGSQQGNLPNWGQSNNLALPHYSKGGKFLNKILNPDKVAKFLLPAMGGTVGTFVGGPIGGSIGAGIGAKLAGGKNSNRNAMIAAAAGYGLGGGFGPSVMPPEMSGVLLGSASAAAPSLAGRSAGSIVPRMIGQGSQAAHMGSTATGISGTQALFPEVGSKAIPNVLGSGVGGKAGNKLSGEGIQRLLDIIGMGGTLLGKHEVPKEDSLEEQIKKANMWSPEQMGKKIKPMNRQPVINGPDEEGKYFIEVNPDTEYYAQGGYLNGSSGGQDDTIDAKLSDGEYVLSADVVSHLGDGNNNAGAKKLDSFMRKVRHHRMKSGGKLPPKSLGIQSYLQGRA